MQSSSARISDSTIKKVGKRGPITWVSLALFGLAGGGVVAYVRYLKEEKEKGIAWIDHTNTYQSLFSLCCIRTKHWHTSVSSDAAQARVSHGDQHVRMPYVAGGYFYYFGKLGASDKCWLWGPTFLPLATNCFALFCLPQSKLKTASEKN